MNRFFSLGDYHYTESDWEGFQPHEVKAQMESQFGAFDDGLWALYERYMRRCVDYLIGRNRITFMFPTYVVKLPWTWDGYADNDWEGSVSNDPDAEDIDWQIKYARTRFVIYHNTPIVFMERVEPLSVSGVIARFGYEPEWVASVDCGQVGLNARGCLVAYDYGIR